MADNTTLNSMTGGDVVAADDIGGVKFQRIKLIYGADNTNAGDVSSTNPFPINVVQSTTVLETNTTPLGIGGTFTSIVSDHSTGGAYVSHYIYSDVGGTHYFESSHDSTTWTISDTEVVTGGVALNENHQAHARYSRARYVNGGTAQATFYHQVIMKQFGQDEYVKIDPALNAITGSKTSNAQAPSSTNLGVLPATANAAAPTLTEGMQVTHRVNLAGDVVVTHDGEIVGVGGNIANNVSDTGNPIKVGGVGRSSLPTSVTTGYRVDATFDLSGRQVVRLGNPRGLSIQNTITLSSTTETTLLAAATSTFHDLTLLIISNSSATAVRVDIRDATAGTVRMSIPVAANGGAVMAMPYPFEQTAVNNNWTAQLSGAVTDVRITSQAIKGI